MTAIGNIYTLALSYLNLDLGMEVSEHEQDCLH